MMPDALLAQRIAEHAENLEPLRGAPGAIADPAFVDTHLGDAGEGLFVAGRPGDRLTQTVDGRLVVVLYGRLRAPRPREQRMHAFPLGAGDLALGRRDNVHRPDSPRSACRQIARRRVTPDQPQRLVAVIPMHVDVTFRDEDPIVLREARFGAGGLVDRDAASLDGDVEFL